MLKFYDIKEGYMTKFGKLFGICLLLFVLGCFCVSEARNVVVPTYYGYGVVSPGGGYIHPYIYGCSAPYLPPNYYSTYRNAVFPGSYHPYYSTGYYPYYAGYFGYGQPYWNGSYWTYTPAGYAMAVTTASLNLRSSPQKSGRKGKNSNVIAGLSYGEQVYVLGRAGNWFLVQTVAAPLRRGYAYSSYLQTLGAVQWPWGAIF